MNANNIHLRKKYVNSFLNYKLVNKIACKHQENKSKWLKRKVSLSKERPT